MCPRTNHKNVVICLRLLQISYQKEDPHLNAVYVSKQDTTEQHVNNHKLLVAHVESVKLEPHETHHRKNRLRRQDHVVEGPSIEVAIQQGWEFMLIWKVVAQYLT